jgi:ABC-type multidrug transport system ATPase subunit
MAVLMGKVKRSSGVIKVNGVEEELEKYKKLIGHVPQDDIMLPELNVRDVLLVSILGILCL